MDIFSIVADSFILLSEKILILYNKIMDKKSAPSHFITMIVFFVIIVLLLTTVVILVQLA
jgi:hypothetical protein